METRPVADPKHLYAQATERTTISILPTVAPATGTANILNNAQGHIHDNTFVTNVNAGPSLKILHEHVAMNAILNAGGRAHDVRCHPGTREVVISHIEKWRDAQDGPHAPILWLSGPAGAGKTAIVQTIAERCIQQKIPQANFFFLQEDSSRHTASPLVATLLHQIILLYPSVQKAVANVLSANPLILDDTFQVQLEQLIVKPLLTVQQLSPSYPPLVLLIDGMDECDSESKHHQREVLHALDKALAGKSCPFRVLVASRDEPQLTMAFKQLLLPPRHISLDQKYSPDSDIRLFVTDQFRIVKDTHHLANRLHSTWPSAADIEGIVEKSSGQFIYAATVMRFISQSVESPALNLQRVQGAVPIATKSPFSQLDAIYTHILSRANDQKALKDILCAHFLKQESDRHPGRFRDLEPHATLQQILSIYNSSFTDDFIHSCIAYLTAIARYTSDGELVFYHGSFPDYILDQRRSEKYFLDIDAFNLKVLPAIWSSIGKTKGVECIAYYGLCRLKALPPNFLNTLLALSLSSFNLLGNVQEMKAIFKTIHDLCVGEDVKSYKRIICRWIKYYRFCLGAFDVAEEELPCSQSYIMMAEISHLDGNLMPTPDVVDALRPATDFDARELGLWVRDLLNRIHIHNYPHRIISYKRLLKAWIFWAVSYDIALENLGYLPHARWYFLQGTVVKRVIRPLWARLWIRTIIQVAIIVIRLLLGFNLIV